MKITRLANFIKLAKSFKDVMNQYRISDPFLAFLVAAYEKEFPWEEIETEEDIKNYLTNTLMPSVMSQVDLNSENGRYLNDVDADLMYQIMPDDEEVMATKATYDIDEAEGKRQLIAILNERKRIQFNDWINELQKEPYSSSPSFQYIVLKPIIERYPPNDRRAGYPLEGKALSTTYDKVKDTGEKAIASFQRGNAKIDLFGVAKAYNKAFESEKKEKASKDPNWFPDEQDPNKGWLKIPSKIEDPANYEKNRDMLYDFSLADGHSWCTRKGGPGQYYLEKANFWLYLVNGYAMVAVKETAGKGPNGESRIDEFRAPMQDNPVESWEPVLELFDKQGWDRDNVSNSPYRNMPSYYDELKNIKKDSRKFDEDPIYRQQILKRVKEGDLKAFDKVSKKSKEAPDAMEAIEEGTLVNLRDTHKAKEIFKNIDKSLFKNEEILRLVAGEWLKEVEKNPSILTDVSIPSQVKKDERLNQALVKAVVNQLAKGSDVKVLTNLPPKWNKNKQLKETVINTLRKGFHDQTKKFEELWSREDIDVFKNIKSNKELSDDINLARTQGWSKEITRDPSIYDAEIFPESLKGQEQIMTSLKNGYKKIIETSGDIPPRAAEIFPNDRFIKEAVKQHLLQQISKSYAGAENTGRYVPPRNVIEIPENLKNDEDVLNIQKGSLMAVFKANPFQTFSEGGEVNENLFPAVLRDNQDIIMAKRDGIAANTRKDPKFYETFKNEIGALGLLDDPLISRETKKGWIKHFNSDYKKVWEITNIPEDHFIQQKLINENDPTFMETINKSLVEYFDGYVSDYLISQTFKNKLGKLPNQVKSNKKVVEAYTKALGKLVANDPWAYTNTEFPETFRENRYIHSRLALGLIAYFQRAADATLISPEFRQRFALIPQSVRSTEDVKVALMGALGRLVANDPFQYENMSDGMQNIPEVQNGLQQAYTALMQPYQALIREGRDPNEVSNALSGDNTVPEFMKEKIQQDLGLPHVMGGKSAWYKKAKNRKLLGD